MRRRLIHLVCLIHVVFLLFLACAFLGGTKDDELFYESSEVVSNDLSLRGPSLPHLKHVTKSLLELGAMDEISSHIVFFNRIPKSGSEMLVLLIQWLEGWNNFRHVRLKTQNKKLTRLEQEELVYNVYDIIRKEAVPICFDQQVHFVNFTSFDRQSPTFINLVRDPTESFVAKFVKNRDDKKALEIVAECLRKDLKKCVEVEDLAIPYFCGQDNRCTSINNDWALKQAKANVEKYYPVVGVLDEVNATLEVFENKIKYFFKGVQSLYYRDLLQQHRNKDRMKPKVDEEIKRMLKRKLKKEYDFYEWIKSRLFGQLQIIYGDHHHD